MVVCLYILSEQFLHSTMQFNVLSIFVYTSLIFVNGLDKNERSRYVACGPSDKCICVNTSQMNCSVSGLQLQVVCEFIGNMTSRNITSLYMAKNRIESISQTDLEECKQLLELDLSDNGVKTIRNNTFSVMIKLESLDLQQNNLSWLYTGVGIQVGFPNSLKIIKLGGNANINMTQNLLYPSLKNLDKLETLYLDGLPYQNFNLEYQSLVSLKTVVLSGTVGYCSIPIVRNETFKGLPTIRHLFLAACGIQDVQAGGFQTLRHLETLDLSENMLLGFRSLRNISYSLQFTNIKMLNYSKVHETFGLTTEIKLRDICFLRNTSLKDVDFSRNRLGRFETNSLLIFPESLKIFRVEDNKFTFGLYLLQLGCTNNVEEYYGTLQNHPHRPEVYDDEPQQNDIKQNIPDIDDCPYMKLEYLQNISKSNIYCHFFKPGEIVNIRRTIPTFSKKIRKIEFAQSNLVYNIPRAVIVPIDNNIEYIDLSNNIFRSWLGPIGPFPKLKYLDLSQCYCSKIKVGFFNFGIALEKLYLQENYLGEILSDNTIGSYIFNNLSKLETLNLSKNVITSLPERMFSGVSSLRTLDLSVNNIEKWTINASDLKNLLHLNLRNNFIQNLPVVLLSRLQENSERLNQSYTIDLRNNTISVSCTYQTFLRWIVKYNNNMIDFQNYNFVDMNGESISVNEFIATVVNLDRTCPSYTIVILVCAIGLSVYLAILIGGVIYRNRWNIRYILRNAKVRHFRYRRLNETEDVQYRYDAFISYANENFRFIVDKLMPGLENKGLKLCLHDKDFLPGNNIADNIVEAISNSRKTIVVLSKAFVRSKWCLYEFNMARMESIYTRDESGCLIVVMLEDVPNNSISDEMLEWIRSNTYLEYSDNERGAQIFWDHFEDALR